MRYSHFVNKIFKPLYIKQLNCVFVHHLDNLNVQSINHICKNHTPICHLKVDKWRLIPSGVYQTKYNILHDENKSVSKPKWLF